MDWWRVCKLGSVGYTKSVTDPTNRPPADLAAEIGALLGLDRPVAYTWHGIVLDADQARRLVEMTNPDDKENPR